MDLRHAAWSSDTSIAPRLGRAVLRFAPESVTNGMYVWTEMLGDTHDRTIIPRRIPVLSDSRLDQFTAISSNMPYGTTPMRYSELAANAICRLLGEPIMFNPWQRARAPAGGPYPEWVEWDAKLADLRARLARLGFRTPP
jgi:hypothetical protein